MDITLWSAGMKESKKLATILGLAGDRLPYSDNVSDRDRSKSLRPFDHEKKPHRLKYLIDSKKKANLFSINKGNVDGELEKRRKPRLDRDHNQEGIIIYI